jgi:group I intron endonuclease
MDASTKIYYCYKATNIINGKVYIGFATDPHARWRNHKRDAEKGRGYAFHAAIRKHGWDAFQFEVICCGKDKRTMLEEVEPALIEQYQSSIDKNGYNIFRHSFGTYEFSKKTRKKISDATAGNKNPFFGKRHSEETRRLMSSLKKGKPGHRKGAVHRLESIERMRAIKTGKKTTLETRLKMSAASLGRQHTKEAKQKMRKPKSEQARRNMIGIHRKVSIQQANEIRTRKENGEGTIKLAIEYGIDRHTLVDIVKYRNAYQYDKTGNEIS